MVSNRFEIGYPIITFNYFCFCANIRGPVTHVGGDGGDDYGGGNRRFWILSECDILKGKIGMQLTITYFKMAGFWYSRIVQFFASLI